MAKTLKKGKSPLKGDTQTNTVQNKSEILTGISSSFSLEEAIKDALTKADVLETDYYKYEVVKIEYETGGIACVNNLLVTIKRVSPK